MFILDIEASGLGEDSYPIEIAWSHRFDPALYDSFLICPPSDWTHWDLYAEVNIHRLSRETLLKEGIPVAEAVARLDQQLAGKVVYSDFVPLDRRWTARLYEHLGKKPTFELCPIENLLRPDNRAAYFEEDLSTPTEHRALADVRKLIRILNHISSE